MINPILVPELRELIGAKDPSKIQEIVDAVHPAELADFVAALDDDEIWLFLAAIPQRQAADIFSRFDLDRQVQLAGETNRQAMARMIEALPHDDRADLVQHLDPELHERILPLVAKADREDIRKLSSYPAATAGALMSSDYATLTPGLTVAQALEQVRLQAPTRETIYYIYVLDEAHRLIGFVSIKNLILAKPTQLVRDVMHEEVISAHVQDDQESVARKIEKYDLLAIPVIDDARKLTGIITHDDALDVIRQEQQEDAEKFMAISGRHQAGQYLRTPALRHFGNRVGWVVALGLLGLISGLIVQSFQELLQFAILVAFIPMLAGAGGNTGSQSATLVIRALALDEIKPRDIPRVLFKEFQVSILLALVLAAVAFARVMAFAGASRIPEGVSLGRVGLAISAALGLQVITATLLGALLPLAAVRLKKDPAVVASPALTTIVDITGLLLFFGTTKLLLRV
jgi:magnesium transporter